MQSIDCAIPFFDTIFQKLRSKHEDLGDGVALSVSVSLFSIQTGGIVCFAKN